MAAVVRGGILEHSVWSKRDAAVALRARAATTASHRRTALERLGGRSRFFFRRHTSGASASGSALADGESQSSESSSSVASLGPEGGAADAAAAAADAAAAAADAEATLRSGGTLLLARTATTLDEWEALFAEAR